MNPAAKLRENIRGGPMIVAPGAYDCITARLIEQAGFGAVYMSGGCSAAMLGFPDYGLTTMSEMADNAGRIAGAVSVPVIADADTGFGNELNVTRTVREYEMRGVAAIQIEDQGFPKRCGHLDGKEIVPVGEFLTRIRAAAAARRNPDTLIVARTDARGVAGFEKSIYRLNAALDAGADVAFFEAQQSVSETERIPRLVHGPCLVNVTRGGKSPVPDLRQVEDMGYRIAILPGLLLMHIIGSCRQVLKEAYDSRRHPVPLGDISIPEMWRVVGAEDWDAIQARHK
ncbi:MAG: isocitrate lyase/PEP mutase family protein [Burkholderiales bacterium]|nr:isocitrate lyase/PEP mutase family protein [Burkholderiales bacterium]